MANGIAIGVSLLLGVSLGVASLLLVFPAILFAGLVRSRPSARFIAMVVLGVLIGALRGDIVEGGASVVLPAWSPQAIGVVASLPVAGGEFERVVLTLEAVEDADGAWVEASGPVIVYLPVQHDGASLGDRLQVRWEYTGVRELAPGYAGYVRSQGAVGSAQIYAYDILEEGSPFFDTLAGLRRSVSDTLMSALPGDSGALAAGFVTGDDTGLQAATEEAFRTTGTAHLTSVSGQNIALLTSFLALWFRPVGPYRRLVTHGSMLLVVWTYALMVGLQAPTLRAVIVATLTIIGVYSGRKPDPLTLLSLTLGAMALANPGHTHTVGFWLSASASFALCSVVRPQVPDGLRRQLVNLLMGPLAASIATLPFIIWTFQEWSPIAPLTNAMLMPITSALFPVVYGFTGVALIFPPLAHALAWIPGIGLDLTISIVERMSGIVPTLYLDGAGVMGAVLVAIPCLACIALMSQDGDRWLRMLQRASSSCGR